MSTRNRFPSILIAQAVALTLGIACVVLWAVKDAGWTVPVGCVLLVLAALPTFVNMWRTP